MTRLYLKQLIAGIAIASFALGTISCRVVATTGDFYGSTVPPKRNILRYVNGDEPESLDPPISTGQPEARIYMALYQGLIDYDPRTLSAIPALAERWDINNDSSEFVFHLRRNAVWSNRDPITAHDFVYSIRRGLSPELASKNAYLAYYITYSEAYNRKAVFVRDAKTEQFVLEKDVAENGETAPVALSQKPLGSSELEYRPTTEEQKPDPDTPFHQLMHSPPRLTLPGDATARNKLLAKNPKLQAALQDKEFVAVSAEDIGVEAVDDYTVRISLSQPAAYFLGLLGHQLFRLVPHKIIE
ncbi:MAG: ABC transporter substrate-binding protein, partial [Pyrinomonadaceae bacterium]